MEFNEFMQHVMPLIQRLGEKAKESTVIDNGYYRKYEVKRGLRDEHGNGVLAGPTQILGIVREAGPDGNGQTRPCEGGLK